MAISDRGYMAIGSSVVDELHADGKGDLQGQVFRARERHRAILEFDPELLVALFKPGRRTYEVTEDAIPDGAHVVGVQFDAMRDVWQILLEHESLPLCSEGAIPWTIRPVAVITDE